MKILGRRPGQIFELHGVLITVLVEVAMKPPYALIEVRLIRDGTGIRSHGGGRGDAGMTVFADAHAFATVGCVGGGCEGWCEA